MIDTLTSVVASAGKALGEAGETIGAMPGMTPRFELFHAANSICSQKVRTVLAHHHLAYVSHSLNLFKGQTYLPEYVRLRMVGCDSFGGALVSRHSGSTAASTGGCDGAVVPTLVDWERAEVIVDSKRICLHLDALADEAHRLHPAALADRIDAELAIVDAMPNYQMLMGRAISAATADTTAVETRTAVAGSFSERKVAWCDRYLAEFAGDATLTAAYTAKRAKELSAAEELFSAEAMAAAYAMAQAAVRGLEDRLAAANAPWLFGDKLTMADLFWGIELLRMRNVGVGTYWQGGHAPLVESLLARVEALPAIRAAITDWPGAMF